MLRQILLVMIACILMGAHGVAAQDPAPTEALIYDPTCTVNFMEAYMSGWEYDHRGSDGVIDVVAAAQVARQVYKAFDAVKTDCNDTFAGFKQTLLRSLHGDYPPEDLARMLSFVDEAIGTVEYGDCSYQTATRYLQQVNWGDTTAIQAGRTVSEIFRTVRNVIPSGECDGTFQIIQEIMSQIDEVPPDSDLISTLYKVVGDATQGHYVSESSCAYTLARTFLQKVEWDGLSAADIVKLVKDTFTIAYAISGDATCESDIALSITAMLLDDSYRFTPDASVIQQMYDAARGDLVPTAEVTPPPIVN